jgi:hypothetical protein
VEVPCLVDRNGIQPTVIGNLPPQLAALNRTNINVQELAVLGALAGDKDAVHHAVLMDPFTSSVLNPSQIHSMVDELFSAQEAWLPQFKGKENSTPGNTTGRRETTDFTINRGRAKMNAWKPHEFDPNNIIYFI